MRIVLTILGVLIAILTVALTFLQLESITFIPVGITILFGILVWYLSKKANKGIKTSKFIIVAGILAGLVTLTQIIFFENEIVKDEQFEQRELESEQESKEELEEIEKELDELGAFE